MIGRAITNFTGLTNSVQSVSPAPGLLSYVQAANPSSSTMAYLQLFDTTESVTLGTTAPTWVIGVGPNQSITLPLEAAFANGLQVAATATPTGSGAPGSALVVNLGVG